MLLNQSHENTKFWSRNRKVNCLGNKVKIKLAWQELNSFSFNSISPFREDLYKSQQKKKRRRRGKAGKKKSREETPRLKPMLAPLSETAHRLQGGSSS